MNPTNPPPRTDLPYLRRRYRAPVAPVTPVAPVAPAAQPTGGTSLSLEPTDLDLSTPAAVPPRAPAGPSRPAYLPPRTRAGTRTILTRQAPTVTLTRIQSGVGVLTLEPARSDPAGDLRLGCAYRLRSGYSSVLYNYNVGPATAPPDSNRPIIIREPGRQETFTLDLTQSRDIDRLIVYAFSGGAPPSGGVTLVATTFGQARIEMAFDRLPPQRVVVLMSLYNIAGEFVVRAEMDDVAATARDACAAFGFDQITWLDFWTPLG